MAKTAVPRPTGVPTRVLVLGMAHEWASWEKTKHSYELWARYVAPRFQGQVDRTIGSQKYVSEHRATIFGPTTAAIGKAFEGGGYRLDSLVAAIVSSPNFALRRY